MAWRLRIHHTTRVRYSEAARASYNEVRMTPRSLPRQTTLEAAVTVGRDAPVWTYRDYWGTTVSAFDIQDPHEELAIEARSTVETLRARPPLRPLSWDGLRERASAGRLLEYLAPTELAAVSADLAAAARERVAGADPRETAGTIADWVTERVDYVPGSTGVATSAQEAWDKGQGVCQDIAHLTVALLREAGLPARYVSGYLHPDPAAEPGGTVTGQSHAWVEYWTGEWAASDPTNRAEVGERHVVVARGRDYSDVPPLKGIYQGPAASTMAVTVEVERLA